jgi:phospholipid transport system transporter-binding protein
MAAGKIAEVYAREDGRLAVSGAVTIQDVAVVMEQGIALFDRKELAIDLGGVTEVDSSAVSLLLEWKREALRRGRHLLFANIPQKLWTLLRLYGISELMKGNVETEANQARSRETVVL